ncbi:MAG: M14 family zinc carboxypeptidase [Candidatus Margulisiibacteriota bacterium]
MVNLLLNIGQIGSVLPTRPATAHRATAPHLKLLSGRLFPFLNNTNPSSFNGFLTARRIEEIAKEIIACGRLETHSVILDRIGSSKANNPIWAIKIVPQEEKHPPAYFIAGHHGDEYAGPQANMHLLKLVLHELKIGGSGVGSLLGNRTLVFIPLATPDAARLDEQGFLVPGTPMSWGKIVDDEGYVVNSNIYHTFEGKIQPGAEAIQKYLESIGVPEIVFDLHETGSVNSDERRKNRYIYAPLQIANLTLTDNNTSAAYIMKVKRGTIDKAVQLFGLDVAELIINGKPAERFTRKDQKILGFSEYWMLRGAKWSYTIETPMKEEVFNVGARVLLHVLAVQEALFEIALI